MLKSPPRKRTARLLLQGIALVYAIAFASLAVQIDGLYGSRGILPAADYLQWLANHYGASAWRAHPTVFWLGANDWMLAGVCWTGVASALALMAGWFPTLSAALCWFLYFSLLQVGRVFLSFQWDILLLEAGFLAIFLPPLVARQYTDYDPEPSPVVIWMMRWLLFRLMFSSGVVKLLSDDPVWWNLSALEYHYWTQPLPTFTAWAANLLPPLVQRLSCLLMFIVELGVPWFIFCPRRVRLVAFYAFVMLQLLIAGTGNYTFFNLLTIVLCISLLDDDAIGAVSKSVRRDRLEIGEWPSEARTWTPLAIARTTLAALVALPLATTGGALMVARFVGFDALPPPVIQLVRILEPWHLTSSYGLFSVMTKERNEVVLEGSDDGVTWREYEFRWKPGDVSNAPMFVAPHQPRLDWQMWFASLADWRRSPWLVDLERRLIDGSPPVVALLARDPFSGKPPQKVRALLYEYRFTDWTTREETGAWWTRRLIGPFSPVVSR